MAIQLSELARTLVYHNQAEIQTIQSDVEAIRRFDRKNEKLRSIWGWLALAGGIVCVLGGITGIATDSPVVFWSLLVIGAIFIIVGNIFRLWHKRLNFDDDRYELLGQVLRLLEKDSASNAVVQARLDLGRPDARMKFVRKGSAGRWEAKFYEDQWLRLAGRLLDGTSYNLAVTERFQHRVRWTTSRSGKWKNKRKTKSATKAVLRLKPKPSKHLHLWKLAPDAANAIQLPDWAWVKSIAVEGGVLVLKVSVKVDWGVPLPDRERPWCDGVHLIAMMFLSLYQIVNLSKVLTKAGPGVA